MNFAELQTRSASPRELVLPLTEAQAALHAMELAGIVLLGWEGWLRYPDGRLGHSAKHQGTVERSALEYPKTYSWFLATMRQAQTEHETTPEALGSTLLFCLTYKV